MGDEDDLCAPEAVAGPEEDPSGEEEVVQNEVGGYIGSCRDEDIILGKEVPDIAELREEKKDPWMEVRLWMFKSIILPNIGRGVLLGLTNQKTPVTVVFWLNGVLCLLACFQIFLPFLVSSGE